MTIPKKGARKITVDNVTYSWVVSQQPISGGNELRVNIERSDTKGALLIVATGFTAWPTSDSIAPGQIRAWVLGAIRNGWDPTQKGPAHVALPSDFEHP